MIPGSRLARHTSAFRFIKIAARPPSLPHIVVTDQRGVSMSQQNGTEAAAAAGASKITTDGKREVRILMIHGYTQSGPLFRAKTRALEKLLQKSLGPLGLAPTLIYPTAPIRLSPHDVPGFVPPVAGGDGDGDAEAESDAWAWFRRDDSAGGAYLGLDRGMRRLADAMRDAGGGIDGALGFSQGGAMAAMLAAAMEIAAGPAGGPRSSPPSSNPPSSGDGKGTSSPPSSSWLEAVRSANGGRPLRFAVVYSGFRPHPADLAWLYDPPIATPTLHYIGSLDTVVDEGRSRALIDRCVDPLVLVHPGGHHVPVGKQWAVPLAGFVNSCCKDEVKGEDGS